MFSTRSMSAVEELRYGGQIFDAHTHVVDIEHLDLMVRIGERYGVSRSLLIVHGNSIDAIKRRYADHFLYAKYFSGYLLLSGDVDTAIREVETLRSEGYSVAKLHFAPFWRTRNGTLPLNAISDPRLDPFFEALREHDIPVLVHIADPDTYYATRYADTEMFGTKDDHISEFEERMDRTQGLRVQVAHFGAQPESHRLANLGQMFARFPTLHVDTGSARWMARELGRNPEASREFVIQHADRILFGTDCVARTPDVSYYEGRYVTERLLFESLVRDVPLPFNDPDTAGRGGTFINGIGLPDRVLHRLYWENAAVLYELE
ncbi:MAG: hypothetical protein DRO73_11450 [Candidatus Thorarchaeota archaeon]|nr:MAG: hypothetical protein DRO73_11450 [Candidatus Thorarchaeota archaeon]